MATAISLSDSMPSFEPNPRVNRSLGYSKHDMSLPFRISAIVLGVAGLVGAVALTVLGSLAIVPGILLGAISAAMIGGGAFDRIELIAAALIGSAIFTLGLCWFHGYVIIPIVL